MKKFLVLFLLLISEISLANDYVSLANKTLPSVVAITTQTTNKEFVGSGFIVDETGLIVTNAHLLNDAESINVLVNNSQTFKASLKGMDNVLDIALIKIEAFELLPFVKLANSDNVAVGQNVMAAGNPMGLGTSISTGIVSAKSRDINSSPYDDYIQTDATINMGNSGGPLFNLDGDVVGIVTAMYSDNLKNSGIGFALPSNQLKWVIDELKKNGKITRGWIGLSISPTIDGIKISEVIENSPVAKAGLSVGDNIIKINEKSIKNSRDFSKIIAKTPINQKIKITTNKGVFDVEVITKPKQDIKTTQINNCLVMNMELKSDTLEVVNVQNNSDAFLKGLKQGDTINSLDNNIILNCQELTTYIQDAKRISRKTTMAKIKTKDGNTHFVELSI